jgi:hypothetical protein
MILQSNGDFICNACGFIIEAQYGRKPKRIKESLYKKENDIFNSQYV